MTKISEDDWLTSASTHFFHVLKQCHVLSAKLLEICLFYKYNNFTSFRNKKIYLCIYYIQPNDCIQNCRYIQCILLINPSDLEKKSVLMWDGMKTVCGIWLMLIFPSYIVWHYSSDQHEHVKSASAVFLNM